MRPAAVPALVLAAALAWGCAPRQTAAAAAGPAADRPVATADPASAAGRRLVLDAVLSTLAEAYVGDDDPGNALRAAEAGILAAADEDEFYRRLNQALQADGGTHLYLYRPGRDLFDRAEPETALVGATLVDMDGYSFVEDIWEGGPAQTAGLRVGDELLPLGGEPARLDPLPGDTHRLRLWVRRARDRDPFFLDLTPLRGPTTWFLAEATRSSIATIPTGACRIGRIHLRTFADEDLVEELITGAHFDEADGLIIDLRGNSGGEVRLAGEVLDLLTRQPSVWISYRDRSHPFPATSWNRPLVVVVDGTTRSAAEIFAAAVQARQLGTLVGDITAGQARGGRLFPMPDGGRLLVPVTRVTLPDGEPLEGRGVLPDEVVARPLMYADGDDPPMARAVQILVDQLACPEDLPPEKFPQQEIGPGPEVDDQGPATGD